MLSDAALEFVCAGVLDVYGLHLIAPGDSD